jgi:hypothetical protein
MRNKKLTSIVMTYMPRFAMLIWALSPLTENIDWLFYTSSIIIITSFLIFVVGAVRVYGIDRRDFLAYIYGTRIDNFIDLFISVTGLLVCCFVVGHQLLIFWAFLVIADILQLMFPNKMLRKE